MAKSTAQNVTRVHYQKKLSREVAMRGRWCMQKVVEESKAMEKVLSGRIDRSSPTEDDMACEVTSTKVKQVLPTRLAGISFTCEEDKYIRLGIQKFGLRWSTIQRHGEFRSF